jgi:hypothetical protein
VKASVNWMYAAKMGSEGADMYEAACALRLGGLGTVALGPFGRECVGLTCAKRPARSGWRGLGQLLGGGRL